MHYSRPTQRGHHRHQAQGGRRTGRRGRHARQGTKSCSRPPTAWPSASTKPTPGRWAATPAASKGSASSEGDELVGMVVADPEATLLTACANGYGKRTPFGPNSPARFGRGERRRRGWRRRPTNRQVPRNAPSEDRGEDVEEGDAGSSSQPLSHAAPRRQGVARHQNHRSQRPGGRRGQRSRRRRSADDDRPRQDPAHRGRRRSA